MEILHLSDTHLGRRGRADAQGASLNARHLWAFRQALAPAFAGEVDLVLHTGDVFDRSRPPALESSTCPKGCAGCCVGTSTRGRSCLWGRPRWCIQARRTAPRRGKDRLDWEAYLAQWETAPEDWRQLIQQEIVFL